MVHCKRPKTQIVCTIVTPIQSSVNNEFTCHIHNGLFSTFRFSILVLCTNSTETLSLILLSASIMEDFRYKDTIIAMVVPDGNGCLFVEPFFKTKFGVHRLACIQGHLIFNVHNLGCSVSKNGPTPELIMVYYVTRDHNPDRDDQES